MSDHILQLTDDTFEQDVIKSSDPVLVDYWAEWCGPCKMIAPILEEIASEYNGRIKVAKLNIDDAAHVAPRQPVEDDHVVQTVQELGPEMRANGVHHIPFRIGCIGPVGQPA